MHLADSIKKSQNHSIHEFSKEGNELLENPISEIKSRNYLRKSRKSKVSKEARNVWRDGELRLGRIPSDLGASPNNYPEILAAANIC